VTALTFFVGKGGVGKTTLSAAHAVWKASRDRNSNVLVISTDPAHSLSDVLQRPLGGEPGRVPIGKARFLTAWEMDPGKLFARFMRRNQRQILDLTEKGSLFTAEEIAPLLDTTLPGMAEVAGLLAILDATESAKYSTVVIDTAPFGHTLRLFEMPQRFSRLLNFLELSSSRDEVLAEHFGGSKPSTGDGFVKQWRARLARLQRALKHAEVFLVTTPENFAVQESLRWLADVEELESIQLTGIIVNRVVSRSGSCARCSQRKTAAKSTLETFRRRYPSAARYIAEDPGYPIMGNGLLRRFGDQVFGTSTRSEKWAAPKQKQASRPSFVKTEWPAHNAPLCFVLGKGGVGKTTVSAGLGFWLRKQRKTAVEICSVDPAPSLDDIFNATIGDTPKAVLGDDRFRASEFDAHSLFGRWVKEIKDEIEDATSSPAPGVHLDLFFERRLLSELLEIVPPGLDEVMAIFRIMDMRTAFPAAQVIIDMAPTGHALELLRMPDRIVVWARLLLKSLAAHRKLALARNAAVKIAELEVRARELAVALKSSETEVFAVMLPEPLPDREMERLLAQLQALRIPCKTIFVNRVMLPRKARSCGRCKTAERWQAGVLAELKRKYPGRDFLVVRNFENEISGLAGLRKLTKELWRLV